MNYLVSISKLEIFPHIRMKMKSFRRVVLASLVLFPALAFAATPSSIWDGGGSNNKWSKGGNWQSDVAPGNGAKLIFTGTTRLTPSNDLALRFRSVTFDQNAGAFTLEGDEIKLRGAIYNYSTERQKIEADVNINSFGEIHNEGDLRLKGTLTLEGGDASSHTTTTFSGDGDTVVKNISGEFADILKQGGGTLTANGTWNTAKISLEQGELLFGENADVTSQYLWLGTGTSGLVLTEPPTEFVTLTVEQGAQVQTESAEVGSEVNSLVDVLVKGGNTVWTSNSMTVGTGGMGLMTISNGADVINTSTVVGGGIPMAGNEYAFGSLTIEGSGSKLKTGFLTVGLFTSGLLTVMDGGKVVADNSAIGIATTEENEKSGLVLVTGTGSLFETKEKLSVGAAGLGGMGVTLGGKAAAKSVSVGDAVTGSGLLTIEGDGSSLEVKRALVVGDEGLGGVVISDKGLVNAGSVKIGKESSGIGSLSVFGRGSLLETENDVVVGDKGTGSFDIYSGGKVNTDGSAVLGAKEDSFGSAIVSGARSRWAISDTLTLGDEGAGRMWIARGAKVFAESAVLGQRAGSYGELLVSGAKSRLVVDGLTVGGDGEGLLVVKNKGAVLATTGITVGGNGTLQIGENGSSYGYLVTPNVNLSTSSSILKFAHDSGLSRFESGITGNGVIRQSGKGSTFIESSNAGFTGRVVVNDGVIGNARSDSFGSADVRLNGGMFAVGQNLNVDSVRWGGGQIAMALGTPMGDSKLTLSGDLTQAKGGGHFAFYGGEDFEFGKNYELLDVAGLIDFTVDELYNSEGLFDLTGSVGKLSNYVTTFSINGGKISAKFADIVIGGDINNTGGPFTPTNANFLVENTVISVAGSQQVNNLTFTRGSFLDIIGSLNLNQSWIDVPTGTGTVRGNLLTTSGSFTKLGRGLLNVLSNMVVAGNADIVDGKLAVNGTLTANDVIVEVIAWLKGSGLVNANLINKGILAPGNSPGTLTVNGNFTQTSSGSLQEEIASLTNFDRLIVSGAANLAGNLDIVPFAGFQLEFGQQFQGFIQAGSINGEFDTITAPDGFRGRVLQNGGTLTLVIAPESYTQVAQNQNQRNVAGALNAFIPATKGDRMVVSTALDLQTEDQYPAAFDAIMPGFYSALPQISLEQITAQNQFVAQRLSAVRMGAVGFNAQGLNMPLTSDRDGKSVMEAKDAKTIITPANATKWGLWVQGNGIFGRMTITNIPSNRFASGGFLGGADYRWSENFSTGIYSGYQGTYSKYANNSSTQINSTLFGLYATYQQGGFYSDAIVGGAYNNYSNRRAIEFSTINRTARSDVNGGQLSAYLDAGYDWQAGKFTFGPLASVQYTYTGLGGFTESGADSLDLALGQQNDNSIRSNLGGRIAYTWNVTDKIIITPEVRMFWQHEYLNGPNTISASLDGGSSPGFDYSTSATGQDSVFAGAGASVQFGPNWNAYFFYNADFGRQDYVGQMISGGLNWKF